MKFHMLIESMIMLQDFGRYPRMRTFIQEYVQALNSQNDGIKVVKNFVKRYATLKVLKMKKGVIKLSNIHVAMFQHAWLVKYMSPPTSSSKSGSRLPLSHRHLL